MDAAALRDDLAARFRRTVTSGARVRARPEAWPALEVPPALRETVVGAARLDACPPLLVEYYTERMPSLLVEQQLGGTDVARELLWRPIVLERLPRLTEALAGIYRALAAEGIDATEYLGAASPAELVAARPTVVALYAFSLFGRGLPLLGAYPAERELLSRELDRADPDAVIDLRLSGNLVHELCHGPTREHDGPPAPWMLAESAAIHLGWVARAAHIFPAEPGEAVPGVSLFVLVGQVLARRFSRAALWRLSLGVPLEELFGRRAARAFAVAGWQDWLARREPPFARDALSAMAWVKLADATRDDERLPPALGELLRRAEEAEPLEAAAQLPPLLEAAGRVPISELPWWREAPTADDTTAVTHALRALFQVNCLQPTFQTHPSSLPAERLFVDVRASIISAERRPNGVYAEPASWLLPPPLMRLVDERGARRVRLEGVVPARVPEIAAALVELALGQGALPEEVVCSWTSSR
jgi:hypothetical protein